MGKLTISMAIFNSYVSLPEGNMLLRLLYFDIFRGLTQFSDTQIVFLLDLLKLLGLTEWLGELRA